MFQKRLADLCWWLRFFSLRSNQFQLQTTVDMTLMPTTFHSPFCCQPPQPQFHMVTKWYSVLQLNFQLLVHALFDHSSGFLRMCSLCSKLSSPPFPHIIHSSFRPQNRQPSSLEGSSSQNTEMCAPAPSCSNTLLWPSSSNYLSYTLSYVLVSCPSTQI